MTYTGDRPRSLWDTSALPPDDAGTIENEERFLSKASCAAFENRILRMARGGGKTTLNTTSTWTGNLRWGRNVVISGGDVQETVVTVRRNIRGTEAAASTNVLDDTGLAEAVQRAENLTLFQGESPDTFPDQPLEVHPHGDPKIWFDSTYNLGAEARGIAAQELIEPAQEAGFLSAGYIEVSGAGVAVRDSVNLARYYPYTSAQYSVTVRNPKGTASGWAGVDFNDWNRIDTQRLSQIALDKSIKSDNPVAVEPGRYVAILEPQAICDLWAPVMGMPMDRFRTEQGMGPFAAGRGMSKIGERVLDERITISADPMDPDCGFVPFDDMGEPYQPVNWFEHGVLKELAYARYYAIPTLGSDFALPNSGAFRMSGGTVPIEEMIATTQRGILVTRFNNIEIVDLQSMLLTGNTRDGLWLIENGKVTKSLRNFRILESPLFILNNLIEMGVPQRVFRPGKPAICPPVKVRDFYFSGLMDAV